MSTVARKHITFEPAGPIVGTILGFCPLGGSPQCFRELSKLDQVAEKTKCRIVYVDPGKGRIWSWKRRNGCNADLAAVDALLDLYDSQPVCAIGHSAGACFAALLAAARPNDFATVVIYAGWLAESIKLSQSAAERIRGLARTRVYCLVGDNDRTPGTKHACWETFSRFARAGYQARFDSVLGAHLWQTRENWRIEAEVNMAIALTTAAFPERRCIPAERPTVGPG